MRVRVCRVRDGRRFCVLTIMQCVTHAHGIAHKHDFVHRIGIVECALDSGICARENRDSVQSEDASK